MGLVKETLEAINRIDRNLAAIHKVLTKDNDDRLYRATYLQKPVETKGSIFDRVMTGKDFCYPDHLSFGGRLRAVRLFEGLTQAELADDTGVTPPHISNLEADKSIPSAMLIRAVSRRFGIDEHWLATGKIEMRGDEERAKLANILAVSKVVPLSGYGEDSFEQGMCDAITQRLRLVGEEVDLDRQDRARCSRYPSHYTQATPEQQKS
jgi:transcriptional regulator with XRE-family HTH domain